VDPTTFKPLDIKWTEGNMPGNAPELVRASADGTVFGMRTDRGSEGHDTALVTLNGNQAQARHTHDLASSLLMPSPDGRFLYTAYGIDNTQLKKIYPSPGEPAQPTSFVPARHGDLFLRLTPKGEQFGLPDERKPTSGGLALHLPGQYRPVVTLNDIEGVAH